MEASKEPCPYFAKGSCKFGDRCEKSHSISSRKKGVGAVQGGETAKDRVKRQRLAGQTGIEGGWKSEEHMRQRQLYD
jgi:hypothetical protein